MFEALLGEIIRPCLLLCCCEGRSAFLTSEQKDTADGGPQRAKHQLKDRFILCQQLL